MFTFALLVLVGDIALLAEQYTQEDDTWGYVLRDLNVYFSFLLNFAIIAFYWVTHQKYFAHYTKTDGRHAFLELLFLFAIVSMPFSNFIMGKDEEGLVPIFFVSFEIFIAGVLLWLSWSYATKNDRLTEPGEVTPEMRGAFRSEALIAALSAAVAAFLALINPMLWLLGFVVVPVAAKLIR